MSNENKIRLTIGNFKLSIDDECRNAIVLGRPGTGKSLLINQMLSDIIKNKNKALVYDRRGEYSKKFYNPSTDFIFNVEDLKHLNYNIFDDISDDYDIDFISKSIIPINDNDKNKYFTDSARSLLVSIFKYIKNNIKNPNNKILFDIASKPAEELYPKYINNYYGVESNGVLATLLKYLTPFKHFDINVKPFNINNWLNSNKGSIIYLVDNIKHNSFTPVISLFIDIVSKNLLNMKPYPNRRIFFLLDEFDNLSKLNLLMEILRTGRSVGSSMWLFMQDVYNIKYIYKEDSVNIISYPGITISFALSNPDTAEIIAKKLSYKDREFITSELLNMDRLEGLIKINNSEPITFKLKFNI